MEQEEDDRPCFYAVLGLPRTCSAEDIKRCVVWEKYQRLVGL